MWYALINPATNEIISNGVYPDTWPTVPFVPPAGTQAVESQNFDAPNPSDNQIDIVDSQPVVVARVIPLDEIKSSAVKQINRAAAAAKKKYRPSQDLAEWSLTVADANAYAGSLTGLDYLQSYMDGYQLTAINAVTNILTRDGYWRGYGPAIEKVRIEAGVDINSAVNEAAVNVFLSTYLAAISAI